MPGTFAQDTNASAAPANVTGVVVNANTGSAIPRALVQLGDRAMLTDHDGKFEFDGLTETHAMLRVTKPGYYFSLEMMNDGSRMMTSAEWSSPLRLQLYPEALLTGTVTAPDGSPLRGVPVNAMRSIFDESGHRWVPAARIANTNVRGEFRIAVPPGEYALRTYYIQHQPDSGDTIMPLVFPDDSSGTASNIVEVSSGEEQHFNLHPSVGRAHAVWLFVESSDPGVPAIQVHASNGSVFPVGPQIVGGNFRIELPNGSYTLTATKYSPDEQQIAETNVTVAGHDVSGVVLRFQSVPTIPLEIHVDSDNGDGATPPNPYVLGLMLQQESHELSTRDFGPIQKDGRLGFRVFEPGSYRLMARNTGSQWYVESATYGDRDLLRQDMVIAPGGGGLPIEVTVSNQTGTLSGRVSTHGVPGRSWIYLIATTPSVTPVVRLQTLADDRITISGVASDMSGSYTAHLAPGSYEAVAFAQRHEADFSNPDTLAPFASHVRTVTIHAGDKKALDLDAVTDAEVKP